MFGFNWLFIEIHEYEDPAKSGMIADNSFKFTYTHFPVIDRISSENHPSILADISPLKTQIWGGEPKSQSTSLSMNITSGSPKFQIAICGGGITGLAFANIMLKHPEIEIRVYEAAQKFEEIGAGLGVWKRVADILEELGLGEDFRKAATWPPKGREGLVFELRKADLPSGGHKYGEWSHAGNVASFHRAHLLDILVKNVPLNRVKFGARAVSYEEDLDSGRVKVIFKDGSTATCDLLVGADGIRSAIRARMYTNEANAVNINKANTSEVHSKGANGSRANGAGRRNLLQYIDPVWTGIVVYRTLAKAHEVFKSYPDHILAVSKCSQNYCGLDKNLIALPIAGGKLINLASYVSDPSKENTPYPDQRWVKDVPQQELKDVLKDFEPDVQALLQFMSAPSKWALHTVKQLPFFSRGRVVLLGDAAHAMHPFLGIGGGIGIEDAYVLSRLLTSPYITRKNIELALQAYDVVRKEPIWKLMACSRRQGLVYRLRKEGHMECMDPNRRLQIIKENTNWILDWDVRKDIRRGLEWIASKCK